MSGINVLPMDEKSIKWRACRAYCRWCERNGVIHDEPGSASDFDNAGNFVLRNSRGELARYHITTRGRLRRVAP